MKKKLLVFKKEASTLKKRFFTALPILSMAFMSNAQTHIDTINILSTGAEEGVSITKLNASSKLILGMAVSPWEYSIDKKIFYSVRNSNLDLINGKQRLINPTDYADALTDAVATEDGSFAVGYMGHRYSLKQREQSGYNLGYYDSDLLTTTFDSQGSIIQQRKYSSNTDEYLYSVTSYLTPQTVIAVGNSLSSSKDYNILVSIFNITSGMSSSSVIKPYAMVIGDANGVDFVTVKIIKLSDGGYMILSNECEQSEEQEKDAHPFSRGKLFTASNSREEGPAFHLTKLNAFGNLVFNKRITHTGKISAIDMVENSSGKIIIIGEKQHNTSFLLSVNLSGDLVSARFVQNSSRMQSITKVSGNNMIITANDLSSIKANIWRLTADSLFTFSSGTIYSHNSNISSCFVDPSDNDLFFLGSEYKTFANSSNYRILFSHHELNTFPTYSQNYCVDQLGIPNTSRSTEFNSSNYQMVQVDKSLNESGIAYSAPALSNDSQRCFSHSSKPTGIGESAFTDQTVNLFPNPSNDSFTITSDLEISRYKIFNQVGQLVAEDKVNAMQSSINSSQFRQGIYFIEVYSQDKLNRIKFIVQH